MSDKRNQKKRLGDVLVQQGTLSEEELNRAVTLQQERSMRLGEMLLQDGLVSKEEIASAMEQVQGAPYADCPPESIEPEALLRIPVSVAERCCALPLEIKDRKLIVAMAEPQNLTFSDELRFTSGMEISPRFSFRDDIIAGIRKFYKGGGVGQEIAFPYLGGGEAIPDAPENVVVERDSEPLDVEFITADSREENRAAMKELRAGMRERTPAVRFVSHILALGAEKGASDIHIEPRVGNMIVRIRVDGILRELMTIPAKFQSSVVSRIKILADMDIADRRIPQDGRFLMQYHGQRLDLRISTLPTHFGEKVVIRLLDPRSTIITLDQLGFAQSHGADLRRILEMPQGMLLVTGPTGSGKSTTLYASLNLLRAPTRNIITVEDPVEYMLDGINQVQVNPKAGLTFATALPSILRQDPDVIMVGEIRDVATAEIALKASQTGHMVLSTLHTNDSIGAITRLVDLGIPSYLIASSVTGVIAQRLVRRLCECKRQLVASSTYLRRLETLGVEDTSAFEYEYEPVGCTVCENTGYKGRVGIYEILLNEGQVRDAIHSNARPEEVVESARSAGFRTMQENGLEKIKEGVTALEEVRRVVPFSAAKAERCQNCSSEILPAFVCCPYCSTAAPNRERSAVLRQK
jgi:type IV pilus assembly protein PilB